MEGDSNNPFKYNPQERDRIYSIGIQEILVNGENGNIPQAQGVNYPTQGENEYKNSVYGQKRNNEADLRNFEKNPLKIKSATNHLSTEQEIANQLNGNNKLLMEAEIRYKAINSEIQSTNPQNPDYFIMIDQREEIDKSIESLKYAKQLLLNRQESLRKQKEQAKTKAKAKPSITNDPISQADNFNHQNYNSPPIENDTLMDSDAPYHRIQDDNVDNEDPFGDNNAELTQEQQLVEEKIKEFLKPVPGSKFFEVAFWLVFLTTLGFGVYFMFV